MITLNELNRLVENAQPDQSGRRRVMFLVGNCVNGVQFFGQGPEDFTIYPYGITDDETIQLIHLARRSQVELLATT